MHAKLPSLRGITLACGLTLASSASYAGDDIYKVTITNLTRSQTFTPILVASHRPGVSLFETGSPASEEMAALAEGGDTGPLTALLAANHKVVDTANSGGLLEPGASVTVSVSARHGAKRISLASMMIPTNDGFIALNDVRAPKHDNTRHYVSPAYDAGTEPNDELCISIPGPVCGGAGGSPGIDGEGYVHIHAGIHGIGDLDDSVYDWRNPVARISITRHDD